MTCKAVQAKLSAYADCELGGFEMLDIRSHVHRCPACSCEMEQIRQLKCAIGNMPESDPGADFADKLKEAIAQCQTPTQRRLPLAAVSTLAFAAALLFSLQAFRSHEPQVVSPAPASAPTVRTNFDLDRDQAYQSGGDYFNDGSFILTASAHSNSHR